jgi:hypothetical protein
MYRKPETTLELVLPKDFQGPLIVKFDYPARQPAGGQRQFVYAVPSSGLVIIAEDLRERVRWTEGVKVRWENGIVMGTSRRDWLLAQDATANKALPRFFFVDPVEDGQEDFWIYVIGTEEDTEALRNKLWVQRNLNRKAFQTLLARMQQTQQAMTANPADNSSTAAASLP